MNRNKILFDLGPDNTLFENAIKRNIDLSKVDTVIISHGHIDHGGALKKFLEVNSLADIYVQREAFEPHYSKTLFFKIPIGIDSSLKTNRQIILLDGDYKIDDELSLFAVKETNEFLNAVAAELQNYENTQFYTCHCTGKKAYHYLSERMNNIHYMSCGDFVEV